VFGSGNTESLTRTLYGGWLPVPVIAIRDGGLIYRQRTFVAPYDRSGGPGSPWLNRQSLGVMEVTVENTEQQASNASVKLSFATDTSKKEFPELRVVGSSILAQKDGRLFASVDASQAPSLTAAASDGGLLLTGAVPAKSSARCYVYIPMWDVKPDDYASLKGGESLVGDVEAYWKRLMAPAMQIEIPDEKLKNVKERETVYIREVRR